MKAFRDLLAQARRGDGAALGRLWQRHERFVTAVARRGLLRGHISPADAEDVAQAVFLDVLRALPRLEDHGEAAWLHLLATAAERRARDVTRLGARRRRLSAQQGPAPRHEAPRSADPASSAMDREGLACLRAAMERLDPVSRGVLLLREPGSRGFAEIASLLGLPSGEAARKQHGRAVRSLRGWLRHPERDSSRRPRG